MANRRIQSLAAILLVSGAVWIVYGRAVDAPFVFDDTLSVPQNSSIASLWPLWGDTEHPGPLSPPKELPTSGRPLVNFSFAMNYHFGKFDPAGYRVFNLIVHVLSSLLLMAIVRRTLRLGYFEGRFDNVADWLALATALLWVVHPLQTETVVYVTQRTELLVGFFYLATLYGSLRFWSAVSPAGRTTSLVLTTLACLAGMASKEMMVTAPVIVLLFERTFVAGSFRRAIQKSWPLYVGLFLSWGLLAWLNYNSPRSDSAGFNREIPAYVWWLTQTKVLLLYLKLTFWPWPLAIHYQLAYQMTVEAAWPWLLLTILLGIATFVLLWKRNPIGFVSAWVLVILSPTLVVPIVTEVAAERRMYLPLAALTTMVVVGGYALAQQVATLVARDARHKRRNRWPFQLAAATGLVLTVVLSMVSVRRLAAYHDELALWQDNLRSQPDDYLAYNNLGNALLATGRIQDAIEQYQHASRIQPNYAVTYYNLGNALKQANRPQDAIQQYRQALQLKEDMPGAHNNLALVLANSDQLSEAIQHYRRALQLKPEYAEAHYNFGNAQIKAGQLQEAEQQYQQALRLKPDFAEAYNNLGNLLATAGNHQQAVEQYLLATQFKRNYVQAHFNLAKAYAQLQRPAEAVAAAQKALDIARSQQQQPLVEQIEAWLKMYRTEHPEKREAPAD